MVTTNPEVVARPQERLERANTASVPTVDIRRIDYLDGLRALAALGVVLVHAFEMFGLGLGAFWGLAKDQSRLGDSHREQLFALTHELVVGQFVWAVEIFIVLSGFSLMLPILRSPERMLRGGMAHFVRGRARRILPPYYAALVLGIAAILIVPGMAQPSGTYNYRDLMIPLTPGAVISHILLVHNVSQFWDLKIIPPMWSIAVEWQIYLLFPLLLVLWRRFGPIATVATALVVGAVQGALMMPLGLPRFPLSHPWYLGLFVLGMGAAALAFSPDPRARRLRESVPWLPLAAVVFALMVALKVLANRFGGLPEWIGDPLIGLSALCLLVYLARTSLERPGRLVRWLSARPLVRIGQFSYSLYLIHAPVLVLLSMGFDAIGMNPFHAHVLMLVVGVPFAIGMAYLFFLAFERPFLSQTARRRVSA